MAVPCIADTDTVALTQDGSGVLTADAIISSETGNGLEAHASGLWSPQRPPLVSTLPLTPVDGDEVIFQDAGWTDGAAWHLRYNAGSASPYKWEFIGGSDRYVNVLTAETRGGTPYAAIATPVEIVLPGVTGDYEVSHGSVITPNTSVARQSVKLGAAAATDNESIQNGNTASVSASGSFRALGLAAGAKLALVYSNNDGTGNATFSRRWLRVRPVRVG